MADITICVSGFNTTGEASILNYYGYCLCTGMDQNDAQIVWGAEIAVGALASTINSTVKDAAIAAAGLEGYTVGALDKKTLIGGAVGL